MVLASETFAGCVGVSCGFGWTWAYNAVTRQVARKQRFHHSRNVSAIPLVFPKKKWSSNLKSFFLYFCSTPKFMVWPQNPSQGLIKWFFLTIFIEMVVTCYLSLYRGPCFWTFCIETLFGFFVTLPWRRTVEYITLTKKYFSAVVQKDATTNIWAKENWTDMLKMQRKQKD